MEAKKRKNIKSALPVRSLGVLALAVGMLVGMAHGQEEKKKENSLPWELQAVRLIRKEKPESEKELQELLKAEHEKGNKKAGLVLALRLAGGFSGEQNHDEARKIIEPLAAEGDADAQWLLAYNKMAKLSFKEIVTEEELEPIGSLIKKAADQGHHGAQAAYAHRLWWISGPKASGKIEERRNSIEYAEKSAAKGNSFGMYVQLTQKESSMRRTGFDELNNEALAVWKAGCVQAAWAYRGPSGHEKDFAESGCPYMLSKGETMMSEKTVAGGLKKEDQLNRAKWFTQAFECGTSVEELLRMVVTETDRDYCDALAFDREGQNLFEAVKMYTKAAEDGHVLAMYRLANCYELGRGTERDEKKAEELYRKAAKQKLDLAALRLGQMLLRRGGKDAKEAGKWLAQAAKQGNVVAKYTLGLCYLKGKGGVKGNPLRAQALFKEAAALCDICSKYELGFAAYFAKGVSEEKKKAALEILNHAGIDCGPLCMAIPKIEIRIGRIWWSSRYIIGDGKSKTDHLEADFMRVMQGNTNALCLYYLLRDLELPKKGS